MLDDRSVWDTIMLYRDQVCNRKCEMHGEDIGCDFADYNIDNSPVCTLLQAAHDIERHVLEELDD